MRLTHSDSEQAKLDAFLRDWPLDRVKRMTLDEYTRHGGRNTFTYLLEQETTPVGMGGGTSYKFGIYARNPESEPNQSLQCRHDDRYSWKSELGSTAQQAFAAVLSAVVDIIEGVRLGKLRHMDGTVLGTTVARKIAFLYQSADAPCVVGCFNDGALADYLESKSVNTTGMSTEELHREIIRKMSPDDNLQSIGLAIHRQHPQVDDEFDPDDDIQTAGRRTWCYNYDIDPKASAGINDRESLIKSEEINMDWACGDLSTLPDDREQGKKAAIKLLADDHEKKPVMTALMAWCFAKGMKEGDLVFARYSKEEFFYGLVTGPYEYLAERGKFRHRRRVKWLRTDPISVPGAKGIHLKSLTLIQSHWAERARLLEAFKINMENLPSIKSQAVGAKDASIPTRVIFYGPPGTGKTFKTREHAITTCGATFNDVDADRDFAALLESGQVEFVTFHQSFDYSDFVVGYKPVTEGGAMVFKPKPGVLLRIAKRARENPEKPHLLIMDEINRGNISKIFGELITLVEPDKREGSSFALTLTLPCPCPGFLSGEEHNKFSLPANVHFLGTMNTADRSIALIDSALRRRFDFVELAPNPRLCPENVGGINVQTLLEKLNKALRKELTRDHQIGHSELMFKRDKYPQGPRPADVVDVVTKKILPQIDEWFHDNLTRKAEVLKGLARKKSQDEDSYETTAELLTKYTAKDSQG